VRSQLDRFKPGINRREESVLHRAVVLLLVSLVMALTALPAASANAKATVVPQTSGVTKASVFEVPADQLGPILSSIPIHDLGLSEAQLGKLLSELSPGLGLSSGELTGEVSTLLGSNSSATIGELVSSLSSGPLGGLLTRLLPGLSPSQLIEALSPAQLSALLDNLAGGEPAGTITSGELHTLLGPLAATLSGEQLESLTRILDELQGGLSLSPTTVGSLAEQAGMTPELLAADVGDAESLPTTTPALQATLGGEGPVVGVLKGAGGLAVTLLTPASQDKGGSGEEGNGKAGETGKGGEDGEGGKAGEGGEGGKAGEGGESGKAEEDGEGDKAGESAGGDKTGENGGGKGGDGGAGAGTSLVVNVVPALVGSASSSASPSAGAQHANLEILSHKVKGSVATIVVQVPAAGKVALSGKGVTQSSRKPTVAERVTLKVGLSRAGVASLQKKHDRLKVMLRVSFAPTKGRGSSAGVTVSFA
jgi:hypothetical protein